MSKARERPHMRMPGERECALREACRIVDNCRRTAEELSRARRASPSARGRLEFVADVLKSLRLEIHQLVRLERNKRIAAYARAKKRASR